MNIWVGLVNIGFFQAAGSSDGARVHTVLAVAGYSAATAVSALGHGVLLKNVGLDRKGRTGRAETSAPATDQYTACQQVVVLLHRNRRALQHQHLLAWTTDSLFSMSVGAFELLGLLVFIGSRILSRPFLLYPRRVTFSSRQFDVQPTTTITPTKKDCNRSRGLVSSITVPLLSLPQTNYIH